jgi:purine-binding chemotaxis protein CheW
MTENTIVQTEENMNELAGKYLTFNLAKEIYGIEILKVQEIIGIMTITQVPRTPEFVRGVINLRGRVIPVVDLRLKFALESKEDTEKTCIIVLQIACGDERKVMSIIVDEVDEVLDIKGEQIESPPTFGSGAETDFIMGMGKIAKRVVLLLDADKVLAEDEIKIMDQIARK